MILAQISFVLFFLKYLWLQLRLQRLVLLLVTWSDGAEPTLLHHLAAAVLVGDPGGQAHTAALRAGAPLGGLLDAVLAGVPAVETHRLLLAVGCEGEGRDVGSRKLVKKNQKLFWTVYF